MKESSDHCGHHGEQLRTADAISLTHTWIQNTQHCKVYALVYIHQGVLTEVLTWLHSVEAFTVLSQQSQGIQPSGCPR